MIAFILLCSVVVAKVIRLAPDAMPNQVLNDYKYVVVNFHDSATAMSNVNLAKAEELLRTLPIRNQEITAFASANIDEVPSLALPNMTPEQLPV